MWLRFHVALTKQRGRRQMSEAERLEDMGAKNLKTFSPLKSASHTVMLPAERVVEPTGRPSLPRGKLIPLCFFR